MVTIKDETIALINNLPDNITLDDIMYELYVKSKIEKAIDRAEDGHLVSHENVKKRFIKK